VGPHPLLRLCDLFPVFLQCAAVALLNRLPPSGPGPGGLNNRGFSTIARAICCDETGAVVTGHSNADSCTSLDRALRGANAVRVCHPHAKHRRWRAVGGALRALASNQDLLNAL